jgi:hypothetical protein
MPVAVWRRECYLSFMPERTHRMICRNRLTRTGRWLLVAGALAMSLAGVVMATHQVLAHSCHADHHAAGDSSQQSDCGLCLHWQHHASATAPVIALPEPARGDQLPGADAPLPGPSFVPEACGRAPPADVSTV